MRKDTYIEPEIRKLLSRLTPMAFDRFIAELFSRKYYKEFIPLKDAGENVFYSEILDSYGGSLHSVFIRHNSLSVLFSSPETAITRDLKLSSTLRRIRSLYEGRLGAWGMISPHIVAARQLQSIAFLTDIIDVPKEHYEESIIPRYVAAARKAGIRYSKIFVGSTDSYLNNSPEETMRALFRTLANHVDGVRIAIEEEQFVVQRFGTESVLCAGVLEQTQSPYEPVFILPSVPEDELLKEFEFLLNRHSSEAQLERFLVENFQIIFGKKYDRIETQIWLPFPEMDISHKKRRPDIFMRNAITSDWHLIELKRADLALVSSSQGVPTLSHKIYGAVQQLRNYSRILSQPRTRDELARRGIEYFEPDVSLVVGRSPNVSTGEWRWMTSQFRGEVCITTYDELLAELRVRAEERHAFLVANRH